mmetsp:Transcript_11766/g.27542  ORF Transcript_11766/g.27542 Transcript_11766/m.27542 type:complete len:702 (+) Transcript_11766:199-2304(+)
MKRSSRRSYQAVSVVNKVSFLTIWLLLQVSDVSIRVSGQSATSVVIDNDKRLNTFREYLDKAGVSPNIGKTIIAPSREAFDRFREEDPVRFEKWTTTPEYFVHFKDLIEWHLITDGIYTKDDIFDGKRKKLLTPQGNITIKQESQMIDNLKSDDFLDSDIEASGAIIHIVDKVVFPPFLGQNMIAQLLESRQEKFSFSNMANLALHIGLDHRLNAVFEGGITFLVPPNRRFNRAEINIPKLLQPDMYNYTRQFLLSHMIKGNYHEAKVIAINQQMGAKQTLIKSELGTHMWITSTEDMVRFQSQELLLPDQPTEHGIFHVLNYPLFPPYITDFAFFTPISTNIDTSDCYRFFAQCQLTSEDISEMFNSTLTLFCPTRDAFTFFNNEDFNRLLSPDWYRHACEFLFNHLTLGDHTRAELVRQAPRRIEMLNGAVYNLRKTGDRPRIQNGNEEGRSNFGDLIALDGYLHTIDSTITPVAVAHSIYDRIQYHSETLLYKINIDFVDLTDLIAKDSPLTVFAPDNKAFQRVEFDAIDGGPIIKRHVLRGLWFCDKLANETALTTVDGYVIDIELKGEGEDQELWVGGGKVYNCDILAHNGVLHYIDRVIGLDFDSPAPSKSPAPTVTPVPTISYPPSGRPVALFAEEFDNGAVPIYLPPVQPPIHRVQADPAPSPASNARATTTGISKLSTAIGTILLLAFAVRI